jgi:hypothetical protein
MRVMPFRDVPAEQSADAEILAAVLGLVPVRSEGVVRLMSKQEVMDRIEELRCAGEETESYRLLADLEFDGEGVFRRSFSQMASKSIRVQTSTLFRMLEAMASTNESRNDLLRRAFAPAVREGFRPIEVGVDEEKAKMIWFSLDQWAALKPSSPEEDPTDVAPGIPGYRPELRTRTDNERLPPDLRKYSRYFLKNLFRLNNIHGHNEFYYPPEVIENYWEVVSPDQGIFQAEMVPVTRSLTVGLYRTERSFGLQRTANPDYFGLAEMIALEKRVPRIKGCRVDVHGETTEDEVALQEALGIETVLFEDGSPMTGAMGIHQELSADGLALFRKKLRELSGVRAEVRFPVNPASPDTWDTDYSVLGFDLRLDPDTGRFLLDDAIVSEPTLDQVVLAVGAKLLALSRQLYREPGNFPQPDVESLDRKVHALIAQAEKEGLTDERAREIVAMIIVLDYYEALAKYSYALSEHLLHYLEGTQVVTLTIPRVLLAILDRVLEERDADDIILEALAREGGA